ncbi:hypothetical protein HELRODRAFT_163009 [Helobdella robusta]|uniref:Uncharacterized protein n=1 Tax=Helobdella robusta TaxID=6412 RepID=T1ETK0_HELRO|nr:hypothetical protein HELRODRAFT_163009 [Helobdella robusta]ESN99460.1 hypothetical protein HELRODRAFT_163009 [Helobdella robusta]
MSGPCCKQTRLQFKIKKGAKSSQSDTFKQFNNKEYFSANCQGVEKSSVNLKRSYAAKCECPTNGFSHQDENQKNQKSTGYSPPEASMEVADRPRRNLNYKKVILLSIARTICIPYCLYMLHY